MASERTINKDLVLKKFVQFVDDLNNVFGQKTKSIKMYHIVLSKLFELSENTEQKNETQDRINQHISILQKFLSDNNEAIMKQDESLLKEHTIKYSDSIYIDIDMVLRHSEEKSAIWKHLLLLSSLTETSSNAKDVLTKLLEEDSDENKIIKNIASKLESPEIMEKLGGMTMSGNPFDMISTLTSSGIMDSIMGGVSGDIQKVNPKKLIGTMRNMLDAISSQIENDSPQ
jgi:hypothetical protein